MSMVLGEHPLLGEASPSRIERGDGCVVSIGDDHTKIGDLVNRRTGEILAMRYIFTAPLQRRLISLTIECSYFPSKQTPCPVPQKQTMQIKTPIKQQHPSSSS